MALSTRGLLRDCENFANRRWKLYLADVRDLLVVDGAAAVRVEGGEDPGELLLGGVEGGGLARLHPLLEAQAAGLVLVEHSEQGLRQHRVLSR